MKVRKTGAADWHYFGYATTTEELSAICRERQVKFYSSNERMGRVLFTCIRNNTGKSCPYGMAFYETNGTLYECGRHNHRTGTEKEENFLMRKIPKCRKSDENSVKVVISIIKVYMILCMEYLN